MDEKLRIYGILIRLL